MCLFFGITYLEIMSGVMVLDFLKSLGGPVNFLLETRRGGPDVLFLISRLWALLFVLLKSRLGAPVLAH